MTGDSVSLSPNPEAGACFSTSVERMARPVRLLVLRYSTSYPKVRMDGCGRRALHQLESAQCKGPPCLTRFPRRKNCVSLSGYGFLQCWFSLCCGGCRNSGKLRRLCSGYFQGRVHLRSYFTGLTNWLRNGRHSAPLSRLSRCSRCCVAGQGRSSHSKFSGINLARRPSKGCIGLWLL